MRVRLADKDGDRSAIIDGVTAFLDGTIPAGLIPVTAGGVAGVAGDLLDLDQIEIYVAESDARVVAGLAMLLVPYTWNPQQLSAEEICFWCDGTAAATAPRALIRFAERRAKERHATLMVMHSLAGIGEKFGRVLQRLGYSPLQTSYLRMI